MDQGDIKSKELKLSFTTAPILRHFNCSLHTVVKTNASNYAIVGVLSQFLDQAVKSTKHPVAFDTRKLTLEEVNCEIQDKEIGPMFFRFQKWRVYLFSVSSTFKLLTDYDYLKYFMTKKV